MKRFVTILFFLLSIKIFSQTFDSVYFFNKCDLNSGIILLGETHTYSDLLGNKIIP
ncbi:MAG: hypothetical protein ABIP51_21495 [Bacteroidia bacterium]